MIQTDMTFNHCHYNIANECWIFSTIRESIDFILDLKEINECVCEKSFPTF